MTAQQSRTTPPLLLAALRALAVVLVAALAAGLLSTPARADEPPVTPPTGPPVLPPVPPVPPVPPLPPVVPPGPPGFPPLLPGSDPWPAYEPQSTCVTTPRPGAVVLRAWVVKKYGGRPGGIVRACAAGARSEHKDGRAFDWSMDARKRRDRLRVQRFLTALVAPDPAGQAASLGRRAGIMYVIWRDRIYSAWNGYAPRPYQNSGCPTLARCSRTLRHRDHVHVSLSNAGADAQTSFYAVRR